MKIAVLVKQVPDTWGARRLDLTTGRLNRTDGDQVIDEIDERALEAALAQRDAEKGAEVVAMVMGPSQGADAVRKALAIGADSAIHILDDTLAGADAGRTAAALARALRGEGFDLVIAGNISTDGCGGVVPTMIAEHLGIPALTSMDTLEIAGGSVRGTRASDAGQQILSGPLPALVTVTERMPGARFPSFKGILAAKKKPVSTVTARGVDVVAASVVLSTQERPPRQAGTVIDDDGTAVQQLVNFLAAQRLV